MLDMVTVTLGRMGWGPDRLQRFDSELNKVYETGRGSIKVRSKYSYDKSANCLEITEIPYTTTVEAIIDKIIELVKAGKIREVSYIRDEIDGLVQQLDQLFGRENMNECKEYVRMLQKMT